MPVHPSRRRRLRRLADDPQVPRHRQATSRPGRRSSSYADNHRHLQLRSSSSELPPPSSSSVDECGVQSSVAVAVVPPFSLDLSRSTYARLAARRPALSSINHQCRPSPTTTRCRIPSFVHSPSHNYTFTTHPSEHPDGLNRRGFDATLLCDLGTGPSTTGSTMLASKAIMGLGDFPSLVTK